MNKTLLKKIGAYNDQNPAIQQLPGQQLNQQLRGFNQNQNNQMPLQPQKPSMLSNIGFDALMGGGMNGGVAAFTKADPVHYLKTTNQFVLRPLNMGAGFATGAISAVPTYFVNKATTSMSNGLANYYSREDNKPSLYHAALIAAPAAVGGIYGLGAITHSIDKGKDLLQSKSFKEAGKHLLDAANPVKHINRGAKEIKNSFLDLFAREKVGPAKRVFGALNLAFLAASAAPALYSYLTKNRAKDKKSKKQQLLGYADDIGNALSTTTASPVGQQFVKRAAYIPILSPLLKAREGMSELAAVQKKLKNGELVANDLEKAQKKIKKGLSGAGYDGLGLATIGAGAYGLHKYRQSREKYFGGYVG